MHWPTCIAVGVPLRAYLVCSVSEPRVSPAICGPFFLDRTMLKIVSNMWTLTGRGKLKDVSRTRARPQLVGADAKRQQEDQHAWREVERDMGHGLGTHDLTSYTEAAPTWLLRGSLSLAPLSPLSHARGTLSLSARLPRCRHHSSSS